MSADCTCREDATLGGFDDLEWFCWMFGCPTCFEARRYCRNAEVAA